MINGSSNSFNAQQTQNSLLTLAVRTYRIVHGGDPGENPLPKRSKPFPLPPGGQPQTVAENQARPRKNLVDISV